MQIGDKVTVIKNPNNREKEQGVKQTRFAKTHQKGIIESASNNLIVIKYENYRESFSLGQLVQSSVEIQDKHHRRMTEEDFRKLVIR